MRPIRFLDDLTSQAPFKIAPEKSQEIYDFCSENSVFLKFTNEKKFNFEVYPKTKEITLPTIALEYVWCTCYTFYTIYTEYCSAFDKGEQEFSTEKNMKVREALVLYKWSIDQIETKNELDWPNNEIRPDRSKFNEDIISVTNELHLSAMAWFIHHEIAHLRLGHPEEALNDETARAEEKDADREATEHILGMVKDEKILQKRGLGVAIAILILTSKDILNQYFPEGDHPQSFHRLYDSIKNYFHDADHLIYAFVTVILHLHMATTTMTIPISDPKQSWKDDFESYLIEFSRVN